MTTCKPRRGATGKTKHAETSIFDLHPSEVRRKYLLLLLLGKTPLTKKAHQKSLTSKSKV
jgi:hypothetical protein